MMVQVGGFDSRHALFIKIAEVVFTTWDQVIDVMRSFRSMTTEVTPILRIEPDFTHEGEIKVLVIYLTKEGIKRTSF